VKHENELNNDLLESDKFWVGKLIEDPEIMTQGETLAEHSGEY